MEQKQHFLFSGQALIILSWIAVAVVIITLSAVGENLLLFTAGIGIISFVAGPKLLSYNTALRPLVTRDPETKLKELMLISQELSYLILRISKASIMFLIGMFTANYGLEVINDLLNMNVREDAMESASLLILLLAKVAILMMAIPVFARGASLSDRILNTRK